jgi:hypothetical protein
VTAAQRLRLVLALGVINIVLAGVALGVGINESTNPPIAVVVPTPGVAAPSPPGPVIESPGPVAPPPASPAQPPSTGQPPSTSQPGGEPASPEPSPTPVVEPTPTPTIPVEPSPVVEPAPSSAPAQPVAAEPTPRPARGGGSNGGNAGPTPPPATGPTPAPAVGEPRTCHASARGVERSDGKACVHKPKKPHADSGRHRGRDANLSHRHHQPAIVDQARRNHRTLHRLRPGRRPR